MAAAAVACGADEGLPGPPGPDAGAVRPDAGIDESDAVYDPNHVLQIEIDMAAADWDALRHQTRTLFDVLLGADCAAQPFAKPWTYFPATVTIDGWTAPMDVGVRKKGFIGSLSVDKPSLKIKFNEYAPDQRYRGLKRLTLNNQRQDPGYINACMGYAVMAWAGVPAPRCNFAHVVVNGRDLGVYANVEPIKAPFLRRHFAGDGGNLYEGTLSDFRTSWKGTFEKKNNEAAADFSDIDAMVGALEGASDVELLDALDPLVDIDDYIDFWAAEVFVAHWDGYAGNRNNFYVYADPGDGRFRFVPWGADAVLHGDAPAVFGSGYLARRLYNVADTRARYLARLRELADQWDPDAWLAEIDRMQALIADLVDATGGRDAFDAEIDDMRAFVRARGDSVREALAGAPAAIDDPLTGPPCMVPRGDLSGSFSTTWGTLGGDPFQSGTGTIDVVYDGSRVTFTAIGAMAGPGEQPGEAVVAIAGLLPDSTAAVVYVTAPAVALADGASFELDWAASFGALLRFTGAPEPELLGYLATGEVRFERAGTAPNAPIVGSLGPTLVVDPPFQAAPAPAGADAAALARAVERLAPRLAPPRLRYSDARRGR